MSGHPLIAALETKTSLGHYYRLLFWQDRLTMPPVRLIFSASERPQDRKDGL